ncbi:Dolichyl-diphosphooligosaccharide--protein glycosyltransferase subunit 1A [Hibiscus syriacus]|uniref:Dolichyl-diphosphooligosaccharide--protein glycosyltransferase subunit 1 n=1 Tax=Hibiscus syriacus TaxID=106335 RepID=A0A6A3BS29_HIBSY|nr:Dolichyl-diphosphooligosaccharide--protein glycosyltransferase subunit 1A [Hibiscus syriacus]
MFRKCDFVCDIAVSPLSLLPTTSAIAPNRATEHFKLIHCGAQNKGEFSRLDFQARPNVRGASAFRYLVANMPLRDFLYESEGKRFLNITYGSSMVELVIDTLIVKGSSDISVAAPFPVEQWRETKISHLDIDSRPVVVLKKTNVVPEHNQYFQVYYRFSKLSKLREPLILILGFFLFFVACIVYTRADISFSKSSAAYLAKQQWEEMEASLHDLYRTGDIQACKAARKAADGLLKELSKELKPLLITLQSSPSAAQILPMVEELVAKERELQEKVMVKHSTVDGYEKKSGTRDIENRVTLQQQKLTALRQEVDDLLELIDEI